MLIRLITFLTQSVATIAELAPLENIFRDELSNPSNNRFKNIQSLFKMKEVIESFFFGWYFLLWFAFPFMVFPYMVKMYWVALATNISVLILLNC